MSKRNPRSANGHRQRQLAKRVKAAYDICALCGQPIDKGLATPHPMSFEVDHIVPVSRGGSLYAWDNVQATHRSCNRRKSNGSSSSKKKDLKTLREPLPTSREW